MIDLFSEYSGKWAVIGTASGKLIGRIVKESYASVCIIELQPVFDMMVRLVQQGGSLGKDTMVLPHDLCSTLDSKLIVVNPSTILLFEDMSEIDREQYEMITKKGADIARQSRSIKSNIVIADKLPLPIMK